MKPIAIHANKTKFTLRWLKYCEDESIPYIKVNCHDSNIIGILKDCSGLMWHWSYEFYKDRLYARQLLTSLKLLRIEVFPDFWGTLFFDDKIGQKYLFEAMNAPVAPTYVFYDKESAINWAKNTDYPKVFKLRTGAGSQNVQLIESFRKAAKKINVAFSRGFNSENKFNRLKDGFFRYLRKKNKANLTSLLKTIFRCLIPRYDEKFIPKEKGYVYFQDFLPNNPNDTRLIVLGHRCFGLRRFNRRNDFRASGSGLLDFDPIKIDKRAVQIAFRIADKLQAKSLALDFLFDQNGNPVITEMSYVFPLDDFSDNCPGYWDSNFKWHEGKQNLSHLMVDDLVSLIKGHTH